ncbi:interferon gamma [Sorex araneus]|uniref:interferon gamma n=1 Tax=Sorex araneus TaxID=42254 RepID=UPI002433DD92|nr:interferon gamma [Sorex araneus]
MNYTGFILALQFCVILGTPLSDIGTRLLNETENLKKHFSANYSDVSDNGPLFLNILKKWNKESDKKIMQSQIISFYFKLFENVASNTTVQRSLNIIKEDLFEIFFNKSKEKLEDFEKLMGIQVNDIKVQKKAINELFNVISDLSPILAQRKRKRSQSQFRGRRASKY